MTTHEHPPTRSPTSPPQRWARANRLLVRKALAEFAHERLLTPDAGPGDRQWYAVRSDDGAVDYRFTARRARPGRTGRSTPTASAGTRTARELPPGRAGLLSSNCATPSGSPTQVLPVYLEEITSTLAGTRVQAGPAAPGAAELADADFQTIETGMTEGHPCFVANNGRLGFGVDEYHRVRARRPARPVRLLWVAAAHRDRADVQQRAPTSTTTRSIARRAGRARRCARFAATHGRCSGWTSPTTYLIPVHPWQWWNRLAVTFAGGGGPAAAGAAWARATDEYLAQQSIRTFFNVSEPEPALRQDRAVGAEHGLHARAVGRVHGGHPGDQRLARRADRRRPGARPARGLTDPPRAGRRGLPAPAVRGGHRARARRTARCSPRCGGRARCRTAGRGERLATMAALLHVDDDGGPLVRR